MPSPAWLHEQNMLIRISGQDHSVSQVMDAAARRESALEIDLTRNNMQDDYAQIDPELSFAAPEPGQQRDLPNRQLGYAAFSPQQRHHFLNWLDDIAQPGPAAFKTLYLAMLEVCLLEAPRVWRRRKPAPQYPPASRSFQFPTTPAIRMLQVRLYALFRQSKYVRSYVLVPFL